MTREEFIAERTRIISEMLDNPDEYGIYPTTKCFEQLDALFDSLSLPPAEGAEKLKEMEELFNLEQQLDIPMKDRLHNSAKGKELFAAIQNKPHSTAEDAEEILRKNCNTCYSRSTGEEEVWSSVGSVLIAMQEFATLHAQKIADKMVSEKLREELIKYEIHWNFVLRDNAEKVVDEYLKSRESHDTIR